MLAPERVPERWLRAAFLMATLGVTSGCSLQYARHWRSSSPQLDPSATAGERPSSVSLHLHDTAAEQSEGKTGVPSTTLVATSERRAPTGNPSSDTERPSSESSSDSARKANAARLAASESSLDRSGPSPIERSSNAISSARTSADRGRLAGSRSAHLPPRNAGRATVPTDASSRRDGAVGDLGELGDFESLALSHNPAYCEAAANVAALRGAWQQAGLPPNLILGYSGQQLGSSGQAEQQGVYIEQEIITGGKLNLDQQVLAWNIRKAQSRLDRVRQSILTDVRVAYTQVLVAQQRRELARRLMESTQQSVEQAEALFRAQEVSRADPLRAQIAAQTATVTYNNSVNRHLAAWRKLASIAGQPDLPLMELTGEVNPSDHALDWDTELDRILMESPEIAAAGAALEAARWALHRARAQVIPDVNVQAIVQDDRATGSTNGNLQVSIPVPLWNRNQGGIRQAKANILEAQRRFDRIRLDLQQRLAAEFQTYANAWNQVDQFGGEDGILAKSEQSMDLLRSGYEAGEFSLIELLAAQQTYIQNHLSYLDALESMAVSAARIRGLLIDGSLSTNVAGLP